MKSLVIPVLVGLAALAIAALPARRAVAHDETNDTEIKIEAPLDFVDCSAQTVTVLGLTIDISAATIDASNSAAPTPTASPGPTPTPSADDSAHSGGADGSGGHGGRVIGSSPSSGCYYSCPPAPVAAVTSAQATSACTALVQGQPVEVKLASDQTPLTATEVKQNGDSADITIKAPIQDMGVTAQTITVLGLTIDVSGAGLDGADDSGDNSQPIDLNQLAIGQFVEVRLDSSTPPLAATELEVKNFTNQANVEVDDPNQGAVDDTDANGNPVEDVQMDVTEMVIVQDPTGTGFVRKRLQFQTSSNGRFNLAGLPTGVARIQVARVHNGITQVGRRTLLVRPNATRQVRIRLIRLRRGH